MTRFWCQISRICANTRSSCSRRKSTPMISAPSAGDSGRHAGGAAVVSTAADELWVCMAFAPIVSRPPTLPGRCRRPIHLSRAGIIRAEPALIHAGSSWLLRINEHEGDAAGLGAAVDPGMVGALLDQHVAGLEMDLGIVEQHVD